MRTPLFAALLVLAACKKETPPGAAPEDLIGQVFDRPATKLEVVTPGATDELAPIQPGELAPPPSAGDGEGLAVLLVGPSADQQSPRQAVAVFDRPMVALEGLDQMNAAVPIRCVAESGKLAGRARWAGTSTAVWVPEGDHFPKGTAVRCEVPAGTAALDGTRLEQATSWSFETARPALVRSQPYDDAEQIDPKRPLLLVFDQDVDPAEVQKHLTLTDDAGKAGNQVKVVLSRPAVRGSEQDDDGESAPMVEARELDRSVLVTARLERDRGYTLRLSPGLRGMEGPLGSEQEETLSFRTVPPAAITGFGPQGLDVPPFTDLWFDLATRTDAAELGAKIKISPAPPDGWNPAEAYAWDRWSYGVRLKPMTTYVVEVAPGARDRYGQTYEHGASWSFTTGHLPALVDAPVGTQLYPATNPSTLPVRSRNVRRLHVGVRPVDREWVTRFSRSWNTWNSSAAPSIQDYEVVFTDGQLDDRIRVAKVDLAKHMKGGRGMLLVEVWSPELSDEQGRPQVSRSLLQVTDLGTTLKLGPNGVTTWVTRLSDATPVGDADVQLYLGDDVVWTGRTNKEGIATSTPVLPKEWRPWERPLWAMVRSGEDVSITTSEDPNELNSWSFGLSTASSAETAELRTHAFTDRGVYRPGDTVHVAMTARSASADGLTIPEGARVTWTCADARGADLGGDAGKLNSHGAIAFDVKLPPEASLGYGHCTVSVEHGALQTSAWVDLPVYAYRAPVFRVDVSAPEHAVVGGELAATGNGRYLFGAAMAGAEAEWRVYAREIDPQPPGWEEFGFRAVSGRAWWDAEYRPEETVATGEAKLDTNGQVQMKVKLPATEQPKTREYVAEVTVTDVARQEISNRASTLVHPASLYVGLRALRFIGVAGQETPWQLVVVSPQGAAQSGVPVSLTVVRRTWDTIRQKGLDGRWTWVSTPKDEVVEKRTVPSGARATDFSFTPKEAGYYVVQAEARDSGGRLTRSEESMYVAGADARWARGDTNEIELVPDKKRYAPGETAKILVKAPRAGMSALVTLEREGVLDRKVLTLKSAAETLEIPLGEDAVPNLFVSVVLVEGAPPADSPDAGMPSYYLGYTEVRVDPSGRALDVAISTDRESYQPGDDVLVTVSVNKAGARDAKGKAVPVAGAHVVLYAVDYGVLSLTGYETPNAFDGYYAPHPLRVRTADSRTRVLDRGHFLAKGAEAGGGGGESTRARTKFVTTPLWDADLSTMKDGRLVRKFKLPDNLTTFQIMAVVDAGADRFGADDHQVRVSLPLLAQPAMPRVLRVGDRALAGVVVHNNRETARTVTVSAQASGVTLKGSPRDVEVPAGGAVEVPFALLDPQFGKATFRFDVKSGSDADALEHSVPVLRPIPAETVASAGVADPSAEERIAKVAGAIHGVGGLDLQVSPTVMVGAGSSLSYLLEYPHGCLEQVTSRMLAAVLARELGPRVLLPVSEQRLTEYIETGAAKIADFRHPSGGLAYWPGSREPSALATAAAVDALRRAGRPVPEDSLAFLRQFLAGKWKPTWWDERQHFSAQARVALVLARLGQGDAGFNSRLYERREWLSLTAKGELLETIALTTGADARTKALEESLQGAVTVEATSARLRDQDDWSALWDGENAPTAAALSGLLVSRPGHPLLPRLARGLVESRAGGFWDNTFTTLRSFRALADYVQKYESGGLAKSAKASLAGRSLLDVRFSGPKAETTTVGLDSLAAGALQITGEGGPVYYESRLSYALETMPARDEGFTIARTLTVLEGSGSAGEVTPGALVQVTLRVVTPMDRQNVAVLDPLPAGLEPIETFFKTSARAYSEEEVADTGWMGDEGEEDLRSWSTWVFDHRELRDDGLALYATWMPAGIHTYQYLARATTPGDYAQPAARVEEMYRPEIFGRTEAGRFVVGASSVAKR